MSSSALSSVVEQCPPPCCAAACTSVAAKDVATSHAELSESNQGRGGQRKGAQPRPLPREMVLFFRVKAPPLEGSFWTWGNVSTAADGNALSLGNPRALMICL